MHPIDHAAAEAVRIKKSQGHRDGGPGNKPATVASKAAAGAVWLAAVGSLVALFLAS
jgi:hypothetical protein